MNNYTIYRTSNFILLGIMLFVFGCGNQDAENNQNESRYAIPTADPDNGSITLPDGFSAFVVADNIGKARHITVNENGDIYVKLSRENNNGSIVALRDTTNDGRADVTEYFGKYGGTGIQIFDNYLYYSSDSAIYRYGMDQNALVPQGEPETIVAKLPIQNAHAAKSITLDGKGNLYVNVGAPSNACQEQDRTPGSLGMDPCPLLEKHGGIWRFSDSKLNQTQDADGYRFATGIRNAVALEWNHTASDLYALQHGRDQLFQLYPQYYDTIQGAELPAEEFLLVKDSSDFGWPYCYFDPYQEKKILAPEYGGDSKKTERCEGVDTPIMAFPGHWAPNDLVFYKGDQFPEKYKNGAFIAFHGSWNRAPKEQKGYSVVFVPFANGKPSGEYEVFADQFAGSGEPIMNSSEVQFRPMGLAEGPEGSLYISDSEKGRIWRVSFAEPKMADNRN